MVSINKKQIFSVLLLVSSLLYTSCGAEAAVPAETASTAAEETEAVTEEAPEPDRLDELGEHDFGGRVFSVLDANDYPDSNHIYATEELVGDIINDGLQKRDTAISERYNVTLEYETVKGAKTGTNMLKKSVLAGESKYQLCVSILAGGALATIATDGVLANLCDIPQLQLDASWWGKLMYENIRLNGIMYFTSGDISPMRYNMPFVTYLNEKLLQDFDVDTNFYQVVKEGKWTLDMLHDLTKDCDQDLNQDGKMHADDDFYGIVLQYNELASSALFIGAGVSLSTIEGDSLTVSLDTEHAENVLEKIVGTVSKLNYAEQNDVITKTFMGDRALALIHTTGTAKGNLRNMESDYLILPMPKFDEAQDTYRSYVNTWTNDYIGIPTTADLEFAGTVTEALDFYSYKYIRPEVYDLVMKQKAARDPESADMLDIVFDNMYMDFNCLYSFGNSGGVLNKCVFDGAPLVSSITKIKDKITADAEKLRDRWVSALEG